MKFQYCQPAETHQVTINKANWHVTININYFDEINFYFARWLSGADPRSSSSQMWETPSTKACKKSSRQASRSRRTNRAVIPLHSSESNNTIYCYILSSLHDHLHPKKSIKTPTTVPNYFNTSYNKFISTKATQEHR
jgi:hypothetical protein